MILPRRRFGVFALVMSIACAGFCDQSPGGEKDIKLVHGVIYGETCGESAGTSSLVLHVAKGEREPFVILGPFTGADIEVRFTDLVREGGARIGKGRITPLALEFSIAKIPLAPALARKRKFNRDFDSCWVYVDDAGRIIPTIRWEMTREGIEDADYLALYEKRHGRARAESLCREIVRTLTDRTLDPKKLIELRLKIGKAISGP